MSLTPQNPVNAPNTTIQIGSIKLSVLIVPDQPNLNISVRLYDGYNVAIGLPRPLPAMTPTEQTNMLAAIKQAVQEAAVPYLDRVLGIGTPTIT